MSSIVVANEEFGAKICDFRRQHKGWGVGAEVQNNQQALIFPGARVSIAVRVDLVYNTLLPPSVFHQYTCHIK
jgi:hypothetical protein